MEGRGQRRRLQVQVTGHVQGQRQVGELLSALPEPGAVTIARSSLDDFCPPHQVELIQTSVLDTLRPLYPRLRVNVKYETPEEAEKMAEETGQTSGEAGKSQDDDASMD